MDNGKLNGVVFLDIKKAFDSVNHGIHEHFGISGMELKWFESYLLHRKQQYLVNGQLSSTRTITCGIPQGSILGSLLFLMYIHDLPDCLRSTTPCMYADDTQIFSSSHDTSELIRNLNFDLANVRNWFVENKLQMHPSKLKFMFIGSSYNLNRVGEQPVVINHTPVSRTITHKYLGVQMDENLVEKVTLICYVRKPMRALELLDALRILFLKTPLKPFIRLWFSPILSIAPLFGTIAASYSKIIYKDFNLVLPESLQELVMNFDRPTYLTTFHGTHSM